MNIDEAKQLLREKFPDGVATWHSDISLSVGGVQVDLTAQTATGPTTFIISSESLDVEDAISALNAG